MRTGSVLALGLLLSACNGQVATDQNATSPTNEQAGPAQWSDRTRGQLRQAIDGRAAHGLDHMTFDVSGSDEATTTEQAFRFATALTRGSTDPTKLYDACTVPRP